MINDEAIPSELTDAYELKKMSDADKKCSTKTEVLSHCRDLGVNKVTAFIIVKHYLESKEKFKEKADEPVNILNLVGITLMKLFEWDDEFKQLDIPATILHVARYMAIFHKMMESGQAEVQINNEVVQ